MFSAGKGPRLQMQSRKEGMSEGCTTCAGGQEDGHLTVANRRPPVEQKGKSCVDFSLGYGAKSRNVGLSILFISEFEERGVRKVTTGITGLWPPSVHSDVAF